MNNPNMNWDPNLYTGHTPPIPGESKPCQEAEAKPASAPSAPQPGTEMQSPPEPAQASAWPPPKPILPGGTRERIFAAVLLAFSLLIANASIMGGSLGFALPFNLMAVATIVYLAGQKRRVTPYAVLCLLGAMALASSYARSSDWLLLSPAFFLVLFAYFMGLTALTGVNARPFGGFSSILDVFYVAFNRSFGQVGPAFRGLFRSRKGGKKKWKPGSAFWGVVIAIPVLCVLVPLLMKADAAFEGLISQFHISLPQNDEILPTIIIGLSIFLLAYSQAVSLGNSGSRPAAARHSGRVSPSAVNAFLGAIAFVYCLYLLSQLAYFFSAFQGILPEGYSHADYARRGFFEMSWIVAINLAIIGIVLTLEKRENTTPKFTRLLCLFFCVFSLLLIATAFSKMVLYMNTYGLTRKRVLTSLLMVWLAVCVVTVGAWLFQPKLPYMKVAVVALLLIANFACWADVDSVIARYNVTAYQSGKLESVDLNMLSELSDGAVPWIAELNHDKDPAVAEEVKNILTGKAFYLRSNHPFSQEEGELDELYEFEPLDWRQWNYATAKARDAVITYLEESGCTVKITK